MVAGNDIDITFDERLRERCQQNLNSFNRLEIDDQTLRLAAVAVVLVRHPSTDDTCFLLTRRTSSLARHSGQYALPGGRLDDGEDVRAAALRELEEELGLTAREENVIGQLDDFATRTGFRITQDVIWLESSGEIRSDPHEVESDYYVPVSDLLQPGVPRLHHIPESESPVLSILFKSLQDEVFTPTAAIAFQFGEVALCGRTTRVAHYEQPVFAWR